MAAIWVKRGLLAPSPRSTPLLREGARIGCATLRFIAAGGPDRSVQVCTAARP
ncbi:hypothetical protein V8J36_13950 [Frigidibacter sp. MR17.14]|uniref:hypothetical protein n=1 Tax=Frigidibacter sp. MR17.14 TaxID=3126509 RepID=UPI003012AD6D